MKKRKPVKRTGPKPVIEVTVYNAYFHGVREPLVEFKNGATPSLVDGPRWWVSNVTPWYGEEMIVGNTLVVNHPHKGVARDLLNETKLAADKYEMDTLVWSAILVRMILQDGPPKG